MHTSPTAASDSGDPAKTGAPAPNPPDNPPGPVNLVTLEDSLNLRAPVKDILEMVATLPAGTVLSVPSGYEVKYINFRKDDGSINRSSTGFLTPVKVVSLPAPFPWSQSRIEEINKTVGGLYVSATIVGAIEGLTGDFEVRPPSHAGSGYLNWYTSDGKPKFTFTAAVVKRFGTRVNQGVPPESMNTGDRDRFQRVYQEMARIADRTKLTPKSLLMIDRANADRLSKEYESSRTIPINGAWTIAVEATAVRHGFENVPCAEFVSEVIRQAYQRAGLHVTDDFSASRGNELIWSKTASVVNLSRALYDAGWVPWDTTKYRAPIGAILMHGSGTSPGHTYIAAGDDGRMIVDNGAPQGRDLRKTSDGTIENMYQTGVFFLPPGIQPKLW